MSKIVLSIIISYFNRLEQFERGLNSLYHQSFSPESVELLVLNDRSGHEVYHLLKRYRGKFRIKYFEIKGNPKKVHHGATRRNFLIRKAKGKYVMITDPEIVHFSNTIKQSINAFKQYGDNIWYCGKVFATESWVNKLGEIKSASQPGNDIQKINKLIGPKPKYSKKIDLSVFSKLSDYHLINPTTFPSLMWCCVVLKDNLLKIRGFNEHMIGWGGDDIDLYKRLTNIGVNQIWDNKFIVYHLPHSLSLPTIKKRVLNRLNTLMPFFNSKAWGSLSSESVIERKI